LKKLLGAISEKHTFEKYKIGPNFVWTRENKMVYTWELGNHQSWA